VIRIERRMQIRMLIVTAQFLPFASGAHDQLASVPMDNAASVEVNPAK
jgi:hypothetical protein